MTPKIVCVDDQKEILSAIQKDLSQFEDKFEIVTCESADEALEEIDDLYQDGHELALIISDHIMPNKNGIEFLGELYQDSRFYKTKKILLTGLATHDDTIAAINKAKIDYYLAKPWDSSQLVKVVKELLTHYVFDSGLDHMQYEGLLDETVLYERIRYS